MADLDAGKSGMRLHHANVRFNCQKIAEFIVQWYPKGCLSPLKSFSSLLSSFFLILLQ